MDSKKVYEAAIEGDKMAKEVYEFTGRILGIALGQCGYVHQPGSHCIVWRT